MNPITFSFPATCLLTVETRISFCLIDFLISPILALSGTLRNSSNSELTCVASESLASFVGIGVCRVPRLFGLEKFNAHSLSLQFGLTTKGWLRGPCSNSYMNLSMLPGADGKTGRPVTGQTARFFSHSSSMPSVLGCGEMPPLRGDSEEGESKGTL